MHDKKQKPFFSIEDVKCFLEGAIGLNGPKSPLLSVHIKHVFYFIHKA